MNQYITFKLYKINCNKRKQQDYGDSFAYVTILFLYES